jgi:energy-converting hydrogenase B subunit D
MTAVLGVAFGLAALSGTAAVLTRRPVEQIVVVSLFGQVLGVLFVALQAPDVALSAVVVGSVVVPLMVMLTLVKIRRDEAAGDAQRDRT